MRPNFKNVNIKASIKGGNFFPGMGKGIRDNQKLDHA